MEGNQLYNSQLISSSSSHSFENDYFISEMNFYGLKKQNFFKIFRKDFIQLVNYIFSVSPPFNIVHNIMSVIRIMQFLLPCFIPAYSNFWIKGSIDQITINAIAIFYYLIPPSEITSVAYIFIILYDVIQILMIIIIIISTIYFKKFAKLPKFIPILIYLYQSTFGHFFHPILFYLIFSGISFLTSAKIRSTMVLPRFLTISVIAFICIGFNFFFMSIMNSQTLVFRPNSLASITSQPQYFIFICNILINICFSLGSVFDKTIQIFLFSINIILYIITAFSVFIKGGFIQDFVSNLVLSSSITGAVFTLIDMLFIINNKNGSLAILFAFIIFFSMMLILDFFILRSYTVKQLTLLDSIKEDPVFFSYVKTPNHFLQLASCGIKNSHPIIINLSFFLLGIEKWKSNQYVYFVYAKFIAIYPEETKTLKYILKAIKIQENTGSAFRCIEDQSRMIMKQRETDFTSELKSKIGNLKKEIQSTKHKIGHVLDVIIRGNLNEIDESTKRAISSINQTHTDIKHLLREYPNNRHVTYIYSNFLNDVVADHVLSHEMHIRTRMLFPGVISSDDQTHEYGLRTFPNLPKAIDTQREQQPALISSTAEITQIDLESKIDDHQRNLDQIVGIKMNIEDLRIPSIYGTKIIRILVSLIIFVLPCIIGLILIQWYTRKLQRPLDFIGSLSMLRALAYQVIGFSLRYVGESLGFFPIYTNVTREPPSNFGSTWDTKKQLEFIVQATTKALQDFDSFRMFEEDNYYINQAQNLIFQNTVPYRFFTSPTNFTDSNISIQAAILDYTIQQKVVLTVSKIEPSLIDTGVILNPINNAYSVSMNTRDALDLMIAYIANNYKHVKKVGKIILIVLITLTLLAYLITLFIELKWINSNKQETYQCLFSLPKNIVSELAENLDTKKSDNQAEEMNKQDENILKIFNSGMSSENSLSDVLLIIAGTILIIVLAISASILFIHLVNKLTESVKNSAPHIYYLQSAYTNYLSSLNYLHIILYEFGGYPVKTINYSYAKERMMYNFERGDYYYHFLNSGGPQLSEVPFKKFVEGIKNASLNNCTISTAEKTDLMSIFECSPVDMTIVLFEPIIKYSFSPYEKGIIDSLNPKDPYYLSLWVNLISPIYELFFEPLHNQIVPSINQDLKTINGQFVPIIVFFLILVILIEIIIYFRIMFIEDHIRSVLLLLLHCKPTTIFSSMKITRILAGDFSTQQSDTLERNSAFFDTVVTSLPNAIMYANQDMIILSANEACKRTFGDDHLVGKSIKDFFMSDKFIGHVENLFASVESNPTEEITYKTNANSELILKTTSMIACGKFVITCRNVTQSHNYNTLILEEKQNSDKLLSTILPPSLVSRVQEGEKNISFSVQSASILFSDIVSFTPWCSSLPEETVMSTLNILFKRFDSILVTKPTMTKIKCIGDCYMAAGGIFAEINQPAVHAKDVVSFGLQSIKEVLLINDEIHQNLKIRVGVNTGGPIVAGVLGIGKPTFEILGPAINRAQQMEQNGFPMKVHISSAVYELICGSNFKICNRRQIECKNEMVETYLVEP